MAKASFSIIFKRPLTSAACNSTKRIRFFLLLRSTAAHQFNYPNTFYLHNKKNPTFGRALFFTEFLTERGESLLHKLKRDESSG